MIRLLVNHYKTVFLLCLMVIAIGIDSFISLPRESSPEIKSPVIFVHTMLQGSSAEEVEKLITRKLEEEIDGIDQIRRLTSISREGLSAIKIEFTSNTKVSTALDKVQEKVDLAKPYFPKEAHTPVVQELNFSSQPVFIFSFTNPNGLPQLEEGVDILEEKIKRIKGVSKVEIMGRQDKEVAINIDPLKLKQYALSINDVMKALRYENQPISGGVLTTSSRQYNLSITGEIKNAQDFNKIMIHNGSSTIPLSHIAHVDFDYQKATSYSRVNSEPSITISVGKNAGVNLIDLCTKVKVLVENNLWRFPPETKLEYSFNNAEGIKGMVHDLQNSMATGLILVILVTVFSLGFRNSTFVSLSIPMSMLISFVLLRIFDITLNMVVLFSLVLALGMLVDNGIVMIENIYRHRSMGKDKKQAAIDGSKEIALPIISSTITTILAFLPVVFMPGVLGEFMSYLPITVIIALTSSLLVALLFNPVFCSKFLKKKDTTTIKKSSMAFDKIQNVYTRFLSLCLRHSLKTFCIGLAITFLGIYLHFNFGREANFFPNIDPGVGYISIEKQQGTPLHLTNKAVREVEAILDSMQLPVRNYQTIVGRDIQQKSEAIASNESHKAYITLRFLPYAQRTISSNDLLKQIKPRLEKVRNAKVEVIAKNETPTQGHPVAFEITGPDYLKLGEYASQVHQIIQSYPSFKRTHNNYEGLKPELKVEIDRAKAINMGFHTSIIAQTLRNAVSGSTPTRYKEGKNEYNVRVKLDERYTNNPAILSSMDISLGANRSPLGNLATIKAQYGTSAIKRTNRIRTVEVWADFENNMDNKAIITAEIAEKVKNLPLERGYKIRNGQGVNEQEEATSFLIKAFLVAVFFIFIILVTQFNSFTQPFIILISVILSIGGVYWGFFLTNSSFILITCGFGIISLAGVVVNNAIVLIDHFNQESKTSSDIDKAILSTGATRLRPVLLTATTTILGLLPMAYGVSFDFYTFNINTVSESAQWWQSLSWTIIYGLAFATALTLVVVPVLLKLNWRFFHRKSQEKIKQEIPCTEYA